MVSKILTANEWMLINQIIYKINSQQDATAVQNVFLEGISALISNIASCFFLPNEKGDSLLAHPVSHGQLTIDDLNEYLDNGQDIDYVKDLMHYGICMVYRETDYFSDSVREATEYYRKYYLPKKLHFCTQIILAYQNTFMGVVSIYNTMEKGDSTDKDIFILEQLKDHLALKIHQLLQSNSAFSLEASTFSMESVAKMYMLTSREQEVLNLMIKHYTNDEISEVLVISVHTLKKHIINIYKKLNVTNRIELSKALYGKSKDN